MRYKVLVTGVLCCCVFGFYAVSQDEKTLPSGFVQGDVSSHSYVPNRYWSMEEGKGILPYLCEYGLMKHRNGIPLEAFHDENIRRIDRVSQWSTVLMLYPRHPHYIEEIINLMLRGYRHRQLFCLRIYFTEEDKPHKPGYKHYQIGVDLLDRLWEARDTELISPEGDRATGRQLINNILMVKLGDEGEGGLRTEGLERIHRIFYERIRDRIIDGEQPFKHIKAWYNMLGYWDGYYAATHEDVTERKRILLPPNSEFIGTDVYQWWGHPWAPFDPYAADSTNERIMSAVQHWHDTFTRFYPEGLSMRSRRGGDTGGPEQQNETHAMIGAVETSQAEKAMLFFIGLSSQLSETPYSYSTPIQTMDAYYDNMKAGPWVGLSWWYFDDVSDNEYGDGTVSMMDGKLLHRTLDNPEGTPYPPEQMKSIQQRFIHSRQRMFDDVVYGQFGHLNGEKPTERFENE